VPIAINSPAMRIAVAWQPHETMEAMVVSDAFNEVLRMLAPLDSLAIGDRLSTLYLTELCTPKADPALVSVYNACVTKNGLATCFRASKPSLRLIEQMDAVLQVRHG